MAKVNSVAYDESLKNYDPTSVVLSEEEKKAFEQRRAILEKAFEDRPVGKYKMELMLTAARGLKVPVSGILSFYLSGSHYHGGGDQKLYFCPGKMKRISECQELLPASMGGHGFHVCGKCGRTWEGEEVIGEIGGIHTLQNWAVLLTMYYPRMHFFSDIVLKLNQDDIRARALIEQQANKGGSQLSISRDCRLKITYAWADLIKDTANGSDLYKKIYAFLRC